MTTARAENNQSHARIGSPLSPKQSKCGSLSSSLVSTQVDRSCTPKQFRFQQVANHLYFVLVLSTKHAKQGKERRLSSHPFLPLLHIRGDGSRGIIDSDKHAFQPSCVQHRHSEGVTSSRPFLESCVRAPGRRRAHSTLASITRLLSPFLTLFSLVTKASPGYIQLPSTSFFRFYGIGVEAPGALFQSLSRSKAVRLLLYTWRSSREELHSRRYAQTNNITSRPEKTWPTF